MLSPEEKSELAGLIGASIFVLGLFLLLAYLWIVIGQLPIG